MTLLLSPIPAPLIPETYTVITLHRSSLQISGCMHHNGSSVLMMWSAPYTLDNVPITNHQPHQQYKYVSTY